MTTRETDNTEPAFHVCAGCSELIPAVAGGVFASGSYYCNSACFDRRAMAVRADNMEPFVPREHDPAADVCCVCQKAWRDCACGETQGDVLDLEHALSEGATMEAKGVVK